MAEKKEEQFLIFLWGIFIAFGLQVLYDGIGEYPNYSLKFWGGLTIETVSCVGLWLWGFVILRKKRNAVV